jgi:peptidoglycan/LPS O-acetylase OafA/YrhL
MNYLPALDGLRALAILAVLQYHLWPESLRGGFSGVDVFFVLSGFLITEVDPESWTGRIVNPESEKRSPCPRNDVSTVPI